MKRTTLFKKIESLPEFQKDLKKLAKKFRTLEEDLENLIKHQLAPYHKLNIDNHGIFRIDDLNIAEPKIFKVRKFACKALKGKGAMSGIRVIYAYYESDDSVEFIEIYYKGEKENEDRARILKHYSDKGVGN